ncbi:uncharacterized protein TM35_000031550 [Trypanosoma theileri]|uniref:Uncharacterized protein n=1 Tax=Trypanosoma theileri TaxID=67003 RepID=A0A1X0P644_9TRYP|nr:uncharacterized protein TM35_000031550 [Trypanosoma theileri]ORC92402.1 hypothetical protein TM35_000031550 [Trypanosoma theileri]
MRYVLCILALLLSCACVHVLDQVRAADLPDQVPDTESETKILLQGTPVNCPPEGTELTEEGKPCAEAAAAAVESGRDLGHGTGDNCREGTGIPVEGKSCAASGPVPAAGAQGPNSNSDQHQSGGGLLQGARGSAVSSQMSEPRSEAEVTTTHRTPENERGNGERGAEAAAGGEMDSAGRSQEIQQQQEGREDPKQSEDVTSGVKENSNQEASPQQPQQTDDTSNDSSAVNTSAASGEGTGAQSSPPSASSQTDGTAEGGNSAETSTNNSASTNPETSTTPTNEESTTTTTTTLPPELTNNKKGDADSSSSISSSVWVRVPLLIVVTLACILVC